MTTTKEKLETELKVVSMRADDSGEEFIWMAEHEKELVEAGVKIHPSRYELGRRLKVIQY